MAKPRKNVDVQDQVRLGVGKCFELCLSGIKYRLFRSLVTVAIVVLAVAFLMTMLCQSVIGRSVRVAVAEKVAPRRHFDAWVSRLTKPMGEEDLLAILAADEPDANRTAEVRAWSGRRGEKLTDEQMDTLVSLGRRERAYREYFENLDEGFRAILLGVETGKGTLIYQRLAEDTARMTVFRENLEKMPAPMSADLKGDLDAFVGEWNAAAVLRARVLTGHADAVEALDDDLAGRGIVQMLAEDDAEDIRRRVGAFAFILTAEELPGLVKQAVLERTAAKMLRLRNIKAVRGELGVMANKKPGAVTAGDIFGQSSSKAKAERILAAAARGLRKEAEEQAEAEAEKAKRIAESGGSAASRPAAAAPSPVLQVDLTAEEMVVASGERLDQERLAVAEAVLAGEDTEGFMGFSRRTMWLIVVSFGVCTVGIVNAMLMSVTERFREIATMKCLGAMDGFIMLLFVLESCLQGVAGGIAGALLGVILGLARGGWDFGWLAFSHMPWLDLAACAGVSLVVGILLAAMAAVYPAWAASRLAPMEALRVE